jgi:hypothetical protein
VVFVNPHDIFVWPDAFWCFREEYRPAWLREENYRVVEAGSEEWFTVTRERPTVKPS